MKALTIESMEVGFIIKCGISPCAGCSTIDDVVEYIENYFYEFAPQAHVEKPQSDTLEEPQEVQAIEPAEPEPKLELVKPEPPVADDSGKQTLTENEQKLLNHLIKCARKQMNEQVIIGTASLASKSGTKRGSIEYLLGKLQEKGRISWKKVGRGYDPVITVHGALDTEAGE